MTWRAMPAKVGYFSYKYPFRERKAANSVER